MREVPIDEVFCAGLPEGADPDDPHTIHVLTLLAMRFSWGQYYKQPGPVPQELRFSEIDWLITDDADAVDAFQPTHDCVTCRAGADQARAFLREHPGQMLAVANLRYTEVWAE